MKFEIDARPCGLQGKTRPIAASEFDQPTVHVGRGPASGNPHIKYMYLVVVSCNATSGEARQKGAFGHADYCNFVNF